jgi:ankyrin repeat protein
MKSMNINQLVINGSVPLSYASQHVACHILNMNNVEEPSINDLFKLSVHKLELYPFISDELMTVNDFSQQHSISDSNTAQMILAQSSFSNENIIMLLRSALISGTVSFRRVLRDFKMTHKRIFAQEINQLDKHQNTLLWYLTTAGLYSSIEELYRLALIELNLNVKNGQLGQTILHYAVVHGNIEGIRIILDIGVNTNLCDRYGRTALHYIALCGTKYKNDVEIMKLLVDYGILPKCELKENV